MTGADRTLRFILMVLALTMLATGCGAGSLPVPSFISRPPAVTLDASADLRIVPPSSVRLASVHAVPSELHVLQGGQGIFTANARDESGAVLGRVTFEWSMDDSRAGRVTPNGVFTATDEPGVYPDAVIVEASQAVGEEIVTARGGVTVVVHTGQIDSTLGNVVVSPSTAQGPPGERIPLRALGIGTRGGLVHDVSLSWRVLDDRAGFIDASGMLTLGAEPGHYRDAIEVEARRSGSDDPPVSALASVYVFSPEEVARDVQAIVSPSLAVGAPDASLSLSLFAFDSRGRPSPIQHIRWSVAEPSAGSISPAGRLTLGSTPGQYSDAVEAVAVLGGQHAGQELRAFADVVVHAPADRDIGPGPLSVQMVPGTLRVRQGEREALNAVMSNIGDRGAVQVEWSATTDAVTVDNRGRVTAEGQPGTYPDAVRALAHFADGTRRTVTADVVVLGPLHRVDIVPSSVALEAGDIVQFTALGYDEAGNRLTDVRFVWSLGEGAPGTMSRSGLYVAGDEDGVFPEAIKVQATQR